MTAASGALLRVAIERSALDRIVWGQPAAEAVAEFVERQGLERVYVVLQPTLAREPKGVAGIFDALGGRCAGVFDRMPPHDPFLPVLEASDAARKVRADALLAIGGGSQIDATKVMQICLGRDIRDRDRLAAFAVTVAADGTFDAPRYSLPALRQIALPTTLSGAELNPQATATDEQIGAKRQFRHPLIVPQMVVFDPKLTMQTPDWLWLSSGMRAVDHCVEALCSVTANPLGDASALHGLELLAEGLRRCKRDARNLAARQACQLGTWLSLQPRATGVVMGASHGIGHVLGGSAGVPHGYTSCVMLPSVLRYNDAHCKSQQARVAAVLGMPAAAAADAVESLIVELGLPTRLSQVGVTPESFDRLAMEAMRDANVHRNPRPIRSPDQVRAILDLAA